MKRHVAVYVCFAALLSIAGTTYVMAQPPADGPPRGPGNPGGQGGQRGPGPGGPRSQLMEALDTDKDGTLSADELKNATTSLAKLDKNNDGKLTQEEIRPQQRGGGQGRPQQGGPQQGGPRQPQGQPGAGVNDPNAPPLAANQQALVFTGGNETDPRDRGRPVVLIAGALGVTSDVFRDAFSRVRPAGPGEQPGDEQVRANKAALMAALGKFGISNDRLDEVSNYYRYVQSRGESWPITPAQGYAEITDGKVTGFVITRAGSGYSSPPTVTVDGMPDVAARVKLAYGPEFSANGSVVSVAAAN